MLANATSYGIFAELDMEEEKQLQPHLCYGPSGKAMPIEKKKFEAALQPLYCYAVSSKRYAFFQY
ncbi:MAG TPA: hypothetical protein VEF76_08200 [Patescibacteria group bacterium]|nr:hypothetical protein [Patescibacteria group bacterium]